MSLEQRMRPYRILSLDGGGIRGAYQAVLLARLADAVPAFLPSVRLFAGTSIGGISAMSLASGMRASELVTFFENHAAKVFDDSWCDDLQDMGKVIGADYDQGYLKRVLERTFGDRQLSGLKRRVLIPSFDLDNEGSPRTWKMKFFHNYPGADSDGAERLVDVALRSSAAPTYFPSYQGYVDGGVGCNNPAMAAVAIAINPDIGRQDLGSLRVFSLSSGSNAQWISGKTLDWGFAQWARPMANLMIDANVGIADYQCRQILGEKAYFRFENAMPNRIATDDSARLDEVMHLAREADIGEAVGWIETHFLGG
jgi:patatin-like phospholipase/acyl hydrolase